MLLFFEVKLQQHCLLKLLKLMLAVHNTCFNTLGQAEFDTIFLNI